MVAETVAAGLQAGAREAIDGCTLLELHRDVLERAVNGPDGGGEAYVRQIADRYRLGADGTRLYGTLSGLTGDTDVEATVRSALNAWGRLHARELARSGRYGVDGPFDAIEGQFGTGNPAVVDQVAQLYREAVAAALPPGFTLVGDQVRGPHPLVEADVKGAVRDVDLGAVIAAHAAAPRRLLTAKQVADLINAASPGSARRTLSRWGVAAAKYHTTEAGRVQAWFDADQVRTAWRGRPGRGRRARASGT